MVYLGYVISVDDDSDADRIKVRIPVADRAKSNNIEDYAYSFPLLPKMMHIKPKVGEYVLILCADDNNLNSQRYYIGPLISQPQFMEDQSGNFNGTAALNASQVGLQKAPSTDAKAIGALADNDDVAIYGRKNSDIILGKNDAVIRCGVRTSDGKEIVFNRKGAYFKLNYDENGKDITTSRGRKTKSQTTATVVADDINLISLQSTPPTSESKGDERSKGLTDKQLQEVLDKAHVLPYGDVLVDVLTKFYEMFKAHTHNYTNLPPVVDKTLTDYSYEYGTRGKLKNRLLSEHVRIN